MNNSSQRICQSVIFSEAQANYEEYVRLYGQKICESHVCDQQYVKTG